MRHLVNLFNIVILSTFFVFGGKANTEEKNGGIYFSNKVFTDDSEKINEMSKNNFDLMEDLYVKIIMNQPLKEVFIENGYAYDFIQPKFRYNYSLRLFIDEELEAKWYYELPPGDFEKMREMSFVLSTDEIDLKRKYGSIIRDYVTIISQLEPGEHEIKIEMMPATVEITDDERPVIAQGKFILEIPEGKMTAFKNKNELTLPLPTATNSELEEAILEESKEAYMNAKPMKALITDVNRDWTYSTDENGNIVYRHIIASVVYKDANNDCWVRSAWYTQEHRGYGQFSDLRYNKPVEGYYNYEFPCEKVKDIQ